MKTVFLFVSILLGAAACQQPSPDEPLDYEALVDYFTAQNPKWQQAIQSKDVSYIVDMYDEDALYAAPDKAFVRGKEGIRQQWQETVNVLDDFRYETQQLQGDGDLLYETGIA